VKVTQTVGRDLVKLCRLRRTS